LGRLHDAEDLDRSGDQVAGGLPRPGGAPRAAAAQFCHIAADPGVERR
jgi:hypothetical protein